MKFADAPKDVQKEARQHRQWGRKTIEPPDGDLWWTDRFSCAVCGPEPSGKLVDDHCHVTGLLRGRLCYSCNGIEAHSVSALWEFWRLHAPCLTTREIHAEPPRYLTEDEVLTLPMADLFALHRSRKAEAMKGPEAEMAATIGRLMFGPLPADRVAS